MLSPINTVSLLVTCNNSAGKVIEGLIKQTKIVKTIISKIDTIYKQIQKNAKKPSTDYLFNNSINKNNNLEKTISKLDKLSSMEGFIPRNT